MRRVPFPTARARLAPAPAQQPVRGGTGVDAQQAGLNVGVGSLSGRAGRRLASMCTMPRFASSGSPLCAAAISSTALRMAPANGLRSPPRSRHYETGRPARHDVDAVARGAAGEQGAAESRRRVQPDDFAAHGLAVPVGLTRPHLAHPRESSAPPFARHVQHIRRHPFHALAQHQCTLGACTASAWSMSRLITCASPGSSQACRPVCECGLQVSQRPRVSMAAARASSAASEGAVSSRASTRRARPVGPVRSIRLPHCSTARPAAISSNSSAMPRHKASARQPSARMSDPRCPLGDGLSMRRR